MPGGSAPGTLPQDLEGAMSAFNVAYLSAVICTIVVLAALLAWDEYHAGHHHP
jgi:hypothetical protein